MSTLVPINLYHHAVGEHCQMHPDRPAVAWVCVLTITIDLCEQCEAELLADRDTYWPRGRR